MPISPLSPLGDAPPDPARNVSGVQKALRQLCESSFNNSPTFILCKLVGSGMEEKVSDKQRNKVNVCIHGQSLKGVQVKGESGWGGN